MRRINAAILDDGRRAADPQNLYIVQVLNNPLTPEDRGYFALQPTSCGCKTFTTSPARPEKRDAYASIHLKNLNSCLAPGPV
jgi:hypothetical protein